MTNQISEFQGIYRRLINFINQSQLKIFTRTFERNQTEVFFQKHHVEMTFLQDFKFQFSLEAILGHRSIHQSLVSHHSVHQFSLRFFY
jgi:hypothetical protein